MSPRQVTRADVEELVRLLSALERSAAALADSTRGTGREEGAETVRAVAAGMIERARDGRLGGARTALPLSRPFGEWDYGAAGRPVWACIDAVDDFWTSRLDEGDFEVSR